MLLPEQVLRIIKNITVSKAAYFANFLPIIFNFINKIMTK